MAAELSHAAYRWLTGRGLLRVRDADRVRFLDGMLSNDVAALEAGQAMYATLLDRKGHLTADLWVLALPDEVWLDTASGRGPAVLEVLDKHIIADAVELEDCSDRFSQVAFEGPGARSAAGAPELGPETFATEGDLTWLAAGTLTVPGVRLLGPTEAVRKRVASSSLAELPGEQAEELRIAAFLPEYGTDMGERTFPAEARLERAISFTKGCYIGQEIVARIHARGAVNKLLVQLRAEQPIAAGDPIRLDGKELGQVTSAAADLALGYVKSAAATPGTPLEIAGVRALVTGPAPDPGA